MGFFRPGSRSWRIDQALMQAFAERYYVADGQPVDIRCPTLSELWRETGVRASRLSPLLRWYWLMVDSIVFKLWWHYHFLFGIKWYDAIDRWLRSDQAIRVVDGRLIAEPSRARDDAG